MAVSKDSETTSLRMRFKVANTQDGTFSVSSRTINQMNPAVTDEVVFNLGAGIGSTLQVDELTDVYREDQARLVSA